MHAELLGDICAELPYLEDSEDTEDTLSSLAKCQAITTSIKEFPRGTDTGLIAQVEDICDGPLQLIDETIQRIMSKSSTVIEFRQELAMIRDSADQTYGHLVNLYHRLLASFGNAQPNTAQTEKQHVVGAWPRASGSLAPPEDNLPLPSGPFRPDTSAAHSATEQASGGGRPDFQQVADALASHTAIVQDFCETFNCWDDPRMTSVLIWFDDCLPLAQSLYPRDEQDLHLLHRQCVESLQCIEREIGRMTQEVSIGPRVFENITKISEQLILLNDLLLGAYAIADD